ncbi:hypothetical protein ALQ04_200047 [Pseudomonas cichorii]|uniref:Uncharacterized protein n=1 Tax=Pseudomonas cichorii TaxID=36746 RepID=A0A3M4LIS4_PSECI|nr:hypothetical protein [Pseudomonas cichorii]MCF8977946.1 hypothetical protein [Pseudomonas syringae]RMQ41418.1 hypothetical protein ALQ04_200047 [Pseudomonas cichorii]
MENDQSSDDNIIEPASTAPPSFSVQARGFDDTETATKVATLVGKIIRELGRHIGLQALDGVTVAFDYDQALLDLDRGYESSHQLRATNSHVFGVAMTPSVIRHGELKSHILVRAPILLPLLNDADEEGIRTAIHVLAHECGHVEVTRQFDQCFPGVLLRGQLPLLDTLRWNTIFAVWDEYAVTWISAPFGTDQTDGYNQTFLTDLEALDDLNNKRIRSYRTHGNVDQILSEVYRNCGNLLKFAAYCIGNLRGKNLAWQERDDLTSVLKEHWFEPFFQRLIAACAELAESYGEWTDMDAFLSISNILDDLVCRAGLLVTAQPDGGAYVEIPFTHQTLPEA